MPLRADGATAPGQLPGPTRVTDNGAGEPHQAEASEPRGESFETVDAQVVRVNGPVTAGVPRVETTLRARRGHGARTTRQRVFVVTDTPVLETSSGGRLIRRRTFLERRVSDLKGQLENKRQLASAKRAYAAQLLASLGPKARTETAYIDSVTYDGLMAGLEGELRAVEAELHTIVGQLAASSLSEATSAESAAGSLEAALPSPSAQGPAVEFAVEIKAAIE